MRLWDLNTGAQAGVFARHPKPAIGVYVAYSEKAKLAATSLVFDEPVRLWDLDTGKVVRDIFGTIGAIACFSPDGKRLAACHRHNGTLSIWDVATGKELLRIGSPFSGSPGIDPHASPKAFCVAISPDGKRLVSGGNNSDRTVRVWDARTGRELHRYEGHTARLECVTFFADGRRIASASQDGTARIWRAPR